MIVCDLCKKPPASKGPGKEMFKIYSAWSHESRGEKPEFVVSIAHVDNTISRCHHAPELKVVCGNCLARMGIPYLIEKEQERKRRYDRETAEPVSAKLLNKGQEQLNEGQKQLPEPQRLIEFKLGE